MFWKKSKLCQKLIQSETFISEELGTLNSTCFMKKDVDFCGYRMIQPTVFNTSHNALANFFEDPGTYTITEFRIITSGIVKSLPKLTAKSNKDQFEQHLSILLDGYKNGKNSSRSS